MWKAWDYFAGAAALICAVFLFAGDESMNLAAAFFCVAYWARTWRTAGE